MILGYTELTMKANLYKHVLLTKNSKPTVILEGETRWPGYQARQLLLLGDSNQLRSYQLGVLKPKFVVGTVVPFM